MPEAPDAGHVPAGRPAPGRRPVAAEANQGADRDRVGHDAECARRRPAPPAPSPFGGITPGIIPSDVRVSHEAVAAAVDRAVRRPAGRRRRRRRWTRAAGTTSTSSSSPATPTSITRASRWRILRPGAGGGRVPGRDPQPARLADVPSRGGSSAGRGCSSASAPATWTRMINHYTANKKVRNDDAYSPRRPDRPAARPGDAALLPAGPRGVPRRAGDRRRRRGVAAAAGPLRLLERHRPAVDPARLQGRPGRLRHGRAADRRDRPAARGRARRCATCATCAAWPTRSGRKESRAAARATRRARRLIVPASRRSKTDKLAFAEATRLIHIEHQPAQRPTLVQYHDRQAVVVNPPALPLARQEMDRDLRPAVHAPAAPDRTREPIPAYEMIKDSVTIMRGCFGGCTFCSITAHQGRIIQSRSQESVLDEVQQDGRRPGVHGRRQRHRRADGEHVPDALHAARGRGEVQAAVVRAPDDLQAARHRPRPARRADEAESAR